MSSFFLHRSFSRVLLVLFIALAAVLFEPARPAQAVVWSTLFTAQDVRDHLSTEQGRQEALAFCRKMGITKVYIESFRDGYQADEATLKAARDFFRQAGLKVSGCVTTVRVRQALHAAAILGLLHPSPDAGAAGVDLPLHRRPV